MSELLKTKKSAEDFLNLKYPMEIVEDEGGWLASVPDLPGCNSFGTTVNDAVNNVQEAKDLWIKSQLEQGHTVPLPTDEDSFSGKFILRIPRTLHRSLHYQAQKQGVSLNHYASYLLSSRHCVDALDEVTRTIINACQNQKHDKWEIYGRHEHGNTVMVGNLSGNIHFALAVRKPPAQHDYKMPPTPASLRRLYQEK
jgi:antitoxin HicB